VFLDQRIIGRIAKPADILARRALAGVGVEQALKDRGVRGVGDHRLVHPCVLSAQCHAPRNRAAPIVPDDGKAANPQRVRQQEHIADQLVRRIGGHILRL